MALSGTVPARGAKVDPFDILTVAVVAGLVIGGAWLALSTTLNHDSGWYLHATKQFLEGARLYRDILEINPPLAFYLTVPPVWLAAATGLFAVDLFFLWVFTLAGASLVLTGRVLARASDLSQWGRRALLLAAGLALVFCTWRQIGQREHFLLIFTMPYLCLVAVRAAGGRVGRGLAVAVGLTAALGFGLKPFFLLVPAVAEFYLLRVWRKPFGLFRAETWSLGAGLALYAVSVFVFTPDYFTRILPWAGEVYYAYVRPPFKVLWHGETLLLLVVLAAYRFLRPAPPLRFFADIFVIAAAAFYVIYVTQMKGWTYHRIPVSAALFVTLVCLLMGAVERVRRPAHWLGVLFVSLALATTTSWLARKGSYRNPAFTNALPVIEAQAPQPGAAIYVLSTNVSHGFPLATYTGLRWASRFPTLWLLPGVVRGGAGPVSGTPGTRQAALSAIERLTVEAVIEDLRAAAPAFVLVDVREKKSYFGELSFDYIAYFSRDPRFAALWRRYERVAELDDLHLYRRR